MRRLGWIEDEVRDRLPCSYSRVTGKLLFGLYRTMDLASFVLLQRRKRITIARTEVGEVSACLLPCNELFATMACCRDWLRFVDSNRKFTLIDASEFEAFAIYDGACIV